MFWIVPIIASKRTLYGLVEQSSFPAKEVWIVSSLHQWPLFETLQNFQGPRILDKGTCRLLKCANQWRDFGGNTFSAFHNVFFYFSCFVCVLASVYALIWHNFDKIQIPQVLEIISKHIFKMGFKHNLKFVKTISLLDVSNQTITCATSIYSQTPQGGVRPASQNPYPIYVLKK